jgi:hypothetical protein
VTGRARRRAVRGLLTFALGAAVVGAGLTARAAESPAAITLIPNCGPAGSSGTYSIEVVGTDFNPDAGVVVTFDAAAGGTPESFNTTSDGFGAFDTVIKPQLRPDGTYLVRADDFRQREATAPFTVPCTGPVSPVQKPPTTPPTSVTPQPRIQLETLLGPPGFVTTVDGFNFPKHSVVRLQWTVGIKPPLDIPLGNATTFSVPLLVFHRDRPGPRQVTATHVSGPTFAPVSPANFLVVLGANQPPGVQVRP